VVVQDLVVGE
jgi:hypothetical protein